jgi:PiT family inorganic phosphate transporter
MRPARRDRSVASDLAMSSGLAAAIAAALAFAFTNGVHDASNAIAALVATRAARPGQALVLAAACTIAGPLLLGSAVANTVGGIVELGQDAAIAVIGSGLVAAVTWNVATWAAGLPSSSGHALVGGLVGAALVVGGTEAVRWGGLDGWRPVGALGTLIALAVSPLIGAAGAAVAVRGLLRAGRRATRRWHGPVIGGEWVLSGALAFGHGANDAQKSVGVLVALLVAGGHLTGGGAAPVWTELACGVALTAGTALGGWRIVRTIGRRIFRLHPLDALSSQGSSSAVLVGASLLGAPVSTTQVVASSIVGVGAGRRRVRHLRWTIVSRMAFAWLATLPATAALAAGIVVVWRGGTT